jgi:hypothetical protein
MEQVLIELESIKESLRVIVIMLIIMFFCK